MLSELVVIGSMKLIGSLVLFGLYIWSVVWTYRDAEQRSSVTCKRRGAIQCNVHPNAS